MSSFLSRMGNEMSHAISDAYVALRYGDDAGKSAKLIYIAKPNPMSKKIAMNLTFLEVNGRAYVHEVQPDTPVARAGIHPKDALQLAILLSPNDRDIPRSALTSDEAAEEYALKCESRGERTDYANLKQIIKIGTKEGVVTGSGKKFFPIVMLFRRTRKRTSLGALYSGLPAFRLDEECERAALLIRKLAPNDYTEAQPDLWDEITYEFLAAGRCKDRADFEADGASLGDDTYLTADVTIPPDKYELQSSNRMNAMKQIGPSERNGVEEAEATMLRGLIKKAKGLAFVRNSKFVMGVSVYGGSGVVIARLPDGTWSAPSAIGMFGAGLGLQFGIEVSDCLLIMQTDDAISHFCSGGSFTIGGNVGAAIAGLGREAYGAASVAGSCIPSPRMIEDDESSQKKPVSEISPIVAYAKSQGLYFGVSLEGSRIYVRDDVNARTYKFMTEKEVFASDLLKGKIPTPPEAEELYTALHAVEFEKERDALPFPPELLRNQVNNEWRFDQKNILASPDGSLSAFLAELNDDVADEFARFETKFKKFLYGGVVVERVLRDSNRTSTEAKKERRTLWLMLPESGSLRLGFISKSSDKKAADDDETLGYDDDNSFYSEDESTLMTEDNNTVYTGYTDGDLTRDTRDQITVDGTYTTENESIVSHQRNADLSNKHSVALTDVVSLSQYPEETIHFSSEHDHLRLLSIVDNKKNSLIFLAHNAREAELLACGIKLLLERETERLGIRGGVPNNYQSKVLKIPQSRIMAPVKEEDFSVGDETDDNDSLFTKESTLPEVPNSRNLKGTVSDYQATKNLPAKASVVIEPANIPAHDNDQKKYTFGEVILKEVASKVLLPLPLPLCRVLLLDSSSPVISEWESERGDKNYLKSKWTFPPGTSRALEEYESEHQIIAKGTIEGAHRTSRYDRVRNGEVVHLTETHIIDADDSSKVALAITERTPRRGFSVKIKIILRSKTAHLCESTVLAEIRPVGKNLSNQVAVHKAFCLVLNEVTARYGAEGKGLMARFLNVIRSLPGQGGTPTKKKAEPRSPIDDSKSTKPNKSTPSIDKTPTFEEVLKAKRAAAVATSAPPTPPRPSTPLSKSERPSNNNNKSFNTNKFGAEDSDPVHIEVKPLPKIRLSLMPSPREEDEDELSRASSTFRRSQDADEMKSSENPKVMEWPTDGRTERRKKKFIR